MKLLKCKWLSIALRATLSDYSVYLLHSQVQLGEYDAD